MLDGFAQVKDDTVGFVRSSNKATDVWPHYTFQRLALWRYHIQFNAASA
jgi:hypothetical protein